MSGAWLVLFLGLWAVCIVLITLVVGLSRRIQALESRDPLTNMVKRKRAEETAEIREQFIGKQVSDKAVESGLLTVAGGMAGVVLFVGAHCGPCEALASDISANLKERQGNGMDEVLGARVTVITDGAGAFHELGATAVLVDTDGAVMNEFAVVRTPTGIALDDDGVVVDALLPSAFSDVEKLAKAAKHAQLNVFVSSEQAGHVGKVPIQQ